MALRRHMKNFVKNYSDSEVKVREATSNDPWGPSSSLMLEISDLTYNTASLSEIMNMIWHRMNDQGKKWRHVYKSLTVLDYLIKNGSKKVIQHCREGFFNIQALKDFHYIDEAGKDQGYYVREKSKQVSALLTDDQLLRNEREIARRTRHRTSYTMLFPKTTTTKDCSPTMSTSEPIPELPDSVKVQLHFPKAASVPQQNQPFQSPRKAAMAQETMAPHIIKKSSEDLIVFSEDEQTTTTTLLPLFPSEVSSNSAPPVVQAAASDSWNRNSTSSMATTSSFSTFSISSPDSVVPENIVHPNRVPSHGPFSLSSPHKISSSVFFNDLKDRVTQPFSCQRSEEEGSENTSILNLLPDNSRSCPGKGNSYESRTLRISGGSWGAVPLQNIDMVVSPSMPPAGSSFKMDTTQKAMGTLEEIKNAVLGLREDIGNVAQQLQTIGNQMASLVGDIQHTSKFLTASQTANDASRQ
nr:ENTH domain-containing protein 1 isoform X3 [Pelodiscus sinensis]|eukprot:XP_014429662.2 ENTH domain-containing protein 1 isoform X3 [Pelodiscus sinensis]